MHLNTCHLMSCHISSQSFLNISFHLIPILRKNHVCLAQSFYSNIHFPIESLTWVLHNEIELKPKCCAFCCCAMEISRRPGTIISLQLLTPQHTLLIFYIVISLNFKFYEFSKPCGPKYIRIIYFRIQNINPLMTLRKSSVCPSQQCFNYIPIKIFTFSFTYCNSF